MIYNIRCKILCAAVKPVGQLNCLNYLANQMKRFNSQQVKCPITIRKKPLKFLIMFVLTQENSVYNHVSIKTS